MSELSKQPLTEPEQNAALRAAIAERDCCEGSRPIVPGEPYMDRKTYLDRASEAVYGDRENDYGHPIDNHGCTAELWRIWLKRMHNVDIPLNGSDVCWLNILQKASRDANAPNADNAIDVAGYAENIGRIRENR